MKELKILNQPPTKSIPMATIAMFDSFKAELINELEKYQGIVYTDEDKDKMAEDKAKLNNYNKALASKKSDIKKLYLEQFEPIDKQFQILKRLIDDTVSGIKEQADSFEYVRQQEKWEDVDKIFNTLVDLEMEAWAEFFTPTLDWFWDDKWFNKGETLKKVEEHLDKEIYTFKQMLVLATKSIPQTHEKYFYRILEYCKGNVGESSVLFTRIFTG